MAPALRTAVIGAAVTALVAATAALPAHAATGGGGDVRAAAAGEPRHLQGRLANGAAWAIDVPADWNGDLVLFSHGYRGGPDNPVRDVNFTPTSQAMQDRGYAVAQSSYARLGWALGTAVEDQLGTLAAFRDEVGAPRRTIALGRSMGGLVSSLIAERPGSGVDAAVSTCGLLGGGLNLNNYQLDGAQAVASLLLPGEDVRLTKFSSTQEAAANADRLVAAVKRAQTSPQGRARISLAAALMNMPTWSTDVSAKPPTDPATIERAEYDYLVGTLTLVMTRRVDIQNVAGGDSSWNAGVDCAAMFARSARRDDVASLYREAGLDLRGDLATITRDARVTADPQAVAWLARTSHPTGALRIPVLTMHTLADPAAPVEYVANYRNKVRAAGAGALLREAYVERTGHCTFTVAENIAALGAVQHRLDTGRWGKAAQPRVLRRAAERTGLGEAAFVAHRPAPFVNDRIDRRARPVVP
ncbi:alpha/beta hydrolase family protein [Agilicoccus flavus]|uniref:alpha/beta hydrolase family protein n=1 Tax=Agilicoccus flavus TaxID=2775968 RepID=UPI001CF633E2|nr:alpha/beta hydrolase [Agilicoccus flavus]